MSLKSVLITYLLATAAAFIIPLPTTLAQESLGLIDQFDLLLLTNKPRYSRTNQALLLVSTKDPEHNAVIYLPNLNQSRVAYTQVTPDPSTDTVYWSTNAGCFGYAGVAGNRTYGVLYNESSRSISDLSYAVNTLYWIEDRTVIKSMELAGKSQQTLVKAGDGEQIEGLTAEQKTGTLYFTKWLKGGSGSIWSLSRSSTPTLIASNLDHSSSLSIPHPPTLHWVGSPSGIYFTIERLNVNNAAEKNVVVRHPDYTANSLAVSCDRVFWTDSSGRRLWEMDEYTKSKPVPEGKQVRGEVLGEKQQDWIFNQVVAIPHECPGHGVTTLNAEPVRDAEMKMEQRSSEEVETKRLISRNPGIRLCTKEEKATCDSNSDVVCVVFGEIQRPLCLTQQKKDEHSVAPPVSATNPPPTTSVPSTTPEPSPAPSSSTPTPDTINSTAQSLKSIPPPFGPSSWPPEVIIIISVLSTLATVMSLISLYMTIRVRNLSRKPIIRRRVVVSTRTSESGSSSPASVCEMIDIENCCNMNVCETPCYERTLLQPSNPNNNTTCTQSTTQNGTTVVSVNSSNSSWGGCGSGKSASKEDKRCLLSR